MQRTTSSFLSCARTAPKRFYSSAPAPASSSSNLAPILLGLGLAGAGGFYYSTLPQKKAAVAEKKKKLIPSDAPAALDKDKFVNFKLAEVIPYNHNTSRFVFDLPEGTNSGLTVASALVVKAAEEGKVVGKNGKDVIRPYTPVTGPDVEGKLELLVKHYKGGLMTEHIFSLKPGQELSIKGPIPKIKYTANEFTDLALIAGGSGITPMYQVMQAIDADPEDKTKVHLVFGNVSEKDILLRQEFEDLAKRKPEQFKIHFVLDSGAAPANWPGPTGFINADVLSKTIPKPEVGDKLKIFVCGPPPQVESISGKKKSMTDQGELKGALKELGYTESQVFKF